MKKIYLLAVLGVLVGISLVTSQALASGASGVILPQAPGGTHGPPDTPTAGPSPTPGPVQNPPSNNPQSNPPSNLPAPAQTAQAAHPSQGQGKPQIFRGELTMVSPTSITLKQSDGTLVVIGLTTDTKIRVPGPKSQGDTLLVGMQVVVMAFTDSSNNLVARFVISIPGQPLIVHRVGTVTAYTAGSSITIKATDGNSYTFTLTSDTKILPEGSTVALNSLVTIIAPRDPSTLIWTATGIVVHSSP